MNFFCHLAMLALALGTLPVAAQTTIFDQNFDGGYTGAFGTGSYSGGNPTAASNAVQTSGGNPGGCWLETMTPTNNSTYYVGQVQFEQISGMVDSNPANYTLSFDANGNRAAAIQFIVQTWTGAWTGPAINSATNLQLAASNTWQTFHINLGNLTTASAVAATWQLEFQISSSQWGGANLTDTLKIDNIILVHMDYIAISASANPSTAGAGVTFTATVQTNGVIAGNATGSVVFFADNLPFSTNEVSGGKATSPALTSLPIGTDSVTAIYSGGNYPAGTNTTYQVVNPPMPTVVTQDNLPLYTDNLVNGFQNWSWATVVLETNAPVHSGSYAIAVTDAGYQALFLEHPDFNTTPYTALSFWANGGSSGGQQFQVYGSLDGANAKSYNPGTSLSANSWQQFIIPLSSLGVSNQPNCNGFGIQGTTGSAQPTFFVDDIQLVAAPAPAVIHLGVNAGQVLETVDARQFGLNTATWDRSSGQRPNPAAARANRVHGLALAGRIVLGPISLDQRPLRERDLPLYGHQPGRAGFHHRQLWHRLRGRGGGLGAQCQPDQPLWLQILGGGQ